MPEEQRHNTNLQGKLKDLVIRHIREQVFEKKSLHCGDQINERELSRTLGVSRSPVREALNELEEQGLIYSIRYKGWFVSTFREEDFFEINKLRVLLEHTLLESVIVEGGPSKKDIEQLEVLNKELYEIMNSPDLGDKKAFEFAEKEMTFHSYLCSLAQSDCFWTKKMLRNLFYQIRCSFDRWLYKDWQMKASVATHDMIIQCLKRKELEKLRALLFRRLGREAVISPGNQRNTE